MSVVSPVSTLTAGEAISKLQAEAPSVEFPLRAERMRPALVRSTVSVRVTGMRPLAVVGDDRLSLEWLAVNKVYLQSIGAMIFVVSAKDASSLNRIQRVSGVTEVLALPHDRELSEQLGILHYPILIDSAKGVIRQ